MKFVNILGIKLPIAFLLLIGAGLAIFLSIYFFMLNKGAKIKEPLVKERTLEDILKSLTAPAGAVSDVPQQIKKMLTAPGKGSLPRVPEEVLESLTAPK